MTKAILVRIACLVTGLALFGWFGDGGAKRAFAKQPTKADPPTKRALLIGISKYFRKGGRDVNGHDLDWWDLHTDLDIDLLDKTITSSKFGFLPGNVRILKTQQETTRASITAAIKKLARETTKGDIVYIHYSGHGQPAEDKTRPDGMVKTIVPSDYRSQADTSNNLRGDEIGKLLDEIKDKEPANLTVTFDSCYSYAAVRGDELPTRGADPLGLIKRGGGTVVNNNRNNFLNRLTLPDGYVFLSAASQIETAKEYYIDGDRTRPIGLFTYALTRAMDSAGPNMTYRDILENVGDFISTIRRDQTPQMEGRTEQKLFAGDVAPPDRYVGVSTKTVRTNSGSQEKVILQAGLLQGMTVGSRFEIYPAGTKKRYKKDEQDVMPLAVTTIDKLDAVTASVTLAADTDLKKLEAKDANGNVLKYGALRGTRAFEIEHNYTSVLKVAVDKALRTARGAGGFSLAALKLDELAAAADPNGTDWNVKIRPPVDCTGAADAKSDPNCQEERDFKGVVLQRPDGSIITRVKDDATMTAVVRTALERESRTFLVRTLGAMSGPGMSSADTSLQVKLRVVPVDVELTDDGKNVRSITGDRTDQAARSFGTTSSTLPGGDFVMLEIQNTGTADAYVTIIDLQPNGTIKPLFPHPSVPHENLIPHGQTYRVPYPYVFRLTEPFGRESFRLIATREPTDFSPLLDPEALERVGRGEGDQRGGNAMRSPLGKFLINAQRGKRGDFAGVPAEWTTHSVTFTVSPRP